MTSTLASHRPWLALLASSALASCAALDQHGPSTPPPTADEPAAARAVPERDAFVELLAGLGVQLDIERACVAVEGRVNMRSGAVEVFACAPEGKLHESIVVLDCVPSALQAGLLALGLEPGTPVVFGGEGEYRDPTGAPVEIELTWRDAQGREQRAHAEDWIWDDARGAPMARAPWIFAGSIEQPLPEREGRVSFAADAVKSLVVTYHDASSLLENPNAAGLDDTSYSANEAALPAIGTAVIARFRRAPQGGAK
ncbi:MAG: hypothetical protein IT454_04880 [Planctomycetes bacterium]|nr:hypothetical protein [Planctomycetota bacterium]